MLPCNILNSSATSLSCARYRMCECRTRIRKESSSCKRRIVILHQAWLVLVDLLVAPLLLLVLCTCVRARPVLLHCTCCPKEPATKEKALLPESADAEGNSPPGFSAWTPLHRAVMTQLGLLFLDLITLPLLLLVTLTGYRIKALYSCSQSNGTQDNLRSEIYHLNLVVQAGVVLHDLAFMIPALLVLGVSVYRALCLSTMLRSDDPPPRSWRICVWIQLGELVLDLPFGLLALPVLASLWRADLLVRDCLLYTSDAADEEDSVDLGGRRIIKKKKKDVIT
eukprot:TRINITY_DN44140_c0_g1_i2.p2 TRINITY_DN44140_c0_g1~~TRINITY_DN44140_c0_g1_i2.p2  ORF type:complete len:281 (+),score=36.03 TRINITY_DN44140_c0_g1_i2:801-1643(+)